MVFTKKWLLKLLLLAGPFAVFLVSLGIGRYQIPISRSLEIFFSEIFNGKENGFTVERSVIINLRIPRIVLATLVGAGLSVSGTAFQGMFRNPLVSPHILGVSSGAGFGGVVALLLFGNSCMVLICSFLSGLLSILLAFYFAHTKRKITTLSLVLSGVIVGSFFTAMISLLKYVADPVDELPSIVFWLMGSFSGTSYEKLSLVSIPIAACVSFLYFFRWRINILSLGEEEVRALGLKPEVLRWMVIIPVTVIVSLCVSVSGIIGWVGLAIPHICRMLVGPDHKVLIPCSISVGAMYMMIIDDISRSVSSAEIPLGILTAIIGIVIFGFLLKKSKGGVWGNA